MVHAIYDYKDGRSTLEDADGNEVQKWDVTSVTVADGVTILGEKAFFECKNSPSSSFQKP